MTTAPAKNRRQIRTEPVVLRSMTLSLTISILLTLLCAAHNTGSPKAIQSSQCIAQVSGVTARLRGISAVNDRVAWASGSESTALRTTDGGKVWRKLTVTSEQLDFRDIDAIDSQVAYVLSIGNGQASRIYKTTDGGETWTLQFKNEDPKAFLDAMTFWDRDHGLVIGDSIDGQFHVLKTENGGRTWSRVPTQLLPPSLENEGAFAASGTNIAIFEKTHAWIGTGAAGRARILRTADGGKSWKVTETPLASGPSSGIFSVAFRDAQHGVVVGGNYRNETESLDNLAFTEDGGASWTLAKGLSGFRSAVAYIPETKTLVAVGPSGADYSDDDGRNWKKIQCAGFDTLSFSKRSSVGWASGARGSLAKLEFK